MVVNVAWFIVGLVLFVWRGVRPSRAGCASAFLRWPARRPLAPPTAGSRGPAWRGPPRPAAAACALVDSSVLAPSSRHSYSLLQMCQP